MRAAIKFLIYLALCFVVLALAVPRLTVWWDLWRGPAGYVADPPNLFLWAGVGGVTICFLVALVIDVGFSRWTIPPWAAATMVATFGIAVLGGITEAPGSRAWTRLSDAPPAAQAGGALARVQNALGEIYRSERRFPVDLEPLEAALVEDDGSPIRSAYHYRGLARRPLALELFEEATGPILRIPSGVLPGTLLYAVDPQRRRYWMTAVVGEGAPATARILATPAGRPLVVSNVSLGGSLP